MRLVALADSDSYVKWGASLAGTLPPEWDRELLVVDSPMVVSDAQLAAALAGSGISAVSRIALLDVAARLAADPPDAVLVATPGPIARVLTRLVADLVPRPVVVAGLPGISIPTTRKALLYRRQADLLVLHSHREVREFARLSRAKGWDHRFGLATLPFMSQRPASGTDLVFAAQAIVPALREDRLVVAAMLRDAALADPTRRVVIKVRALAGENQTHPERDGYPDLIAELGPVPQNLVVSAVPMAEALDTAAGLVTVSSTAVIEALARRIPAIVIDTFGVRRSLINPVFQESGLFGGRDAVVAREFRHPEPSWLNDNYFHDPVADDWAQTLEALVLARRAGELEGRSSHLPRGGALRAAWDRKRAFGDADRSLGGRVALVVGMPLRAAVRAKNRAGRRFRSRLRTWRSLRASAG
ncbi:DUF6716 putative glycosyltransferase [Pseudolysinimonas sp.]|uniref:DUF6716 putative glycosyltransferase n=1 Tax=Pseudolysinimonas sp. TaxID=2680009 RepID=UPI00286BFFE6|nr:DUF6716 putative glycosyltransferase [Pseudolysinimonas sp.]